MRTLLLLPFLIMFVQQDQNGSAVDQGANEVVAVLSSKWSKSRQTPTPTETATTAPAQAMIPANKYFERTRRANVPAGEIDPNEFTIDGRRAALDKAMQESRTPKVKPVDGFNYQVKIRNSGPKVIEVLFWEYQFKETANPSNIVRRQFLCGVNIKPDKEKELQVFSSLGPSNVISVGSLAKQPGNLFIEKVVINRVEYSDGTILQRKGWNFSEMMPAIKRVLGTPWGAEMCRGL